ncbi:AAA domain-containing protein [Flavobacterium sp. 103]|uniref:AAA family ATPase n=1 Tax=Flavobacterium sp. 103 TaxID=2135624 RepID=UPI000D5F96BE|nr:AAA family ATPase [Flavobacterium sp. 103]PVX47221.1 AAA domain-containing protein [Flavobacterium sp. 103]
METTNSQSPNNLSLTPQVKDNDFTNTKLNPVFDDLNDPKTYLSHLQELTKKSVAQSLATTQVGIKDIKAEEERNLAIESGEIKGLFIVKPANSWIELAKTRPIPKMLFGEFWFEGELCILFADTNLGKSILAVQIGDSISTGKEIQGFKLEATKQPILYFDFELSDKQFENRYSSNFDSHYKWDDNFIRIEIDPDASIPENQTFEDYLNHSLERSIKETGAKVLIIDNLTYLKNENEKAKDALPLMKHLKALKSKYGLSILALAHTPKRDLSKPITRNDLQGSKMLINFCDSSFSIGESNTDKSLRYLKQIKQRNTEQIYDAENVCVCKIDKPFNFLEFELIDFGTEREHLKQVNENEKKELESNVKDLMQAEPTLSAYGIAKRLCTDENKFQSFKVKVNRIVNRNSNNSNT